MSAIKLLWETLRLQFQCASAATRLMRGGARIDLPRRVDGEQFIRVGRGAHIRAGAWLGVYPQEKPKDISPRIVIAPNAYLGHNSCISAVEFIEIGEGTMISDYFFASDHLHGYDPKGPRPALQPLLEKGRVKIGKNCSIGMGVSVLPNVELGDWCVVGANAVVTRSFPGFKMLAGAPAKIIKMYDPNSGTWMPTN